MTFTSGAFFVFFFILLTFYWLLSKTDWQNRLLLAASYIFYATFNPWFCLLLAASTLVDYYLAQGMAGSQNRKKVCLWVSLATNLGLLGYFKYCNFFISSASGLLNSLGIHGSAPALAILLPVGLSFYTLKKLSYILDVYHNVTSPVTSLADFALFVAYFPQITAGPIDRARNLVPQLQQPRRWNAENFYSAWPLLVMGLFKKFVIADNVTVIVDKIFGLKSPSIVLLLVGALGFTLQVLADFSAYTDLSRGISFLLGIKTPQNFNSPYLSITPTDFWNRWHMTLSSWLRDYIFNPLRRWLLKHGHGASSLLTWLIPPLVTMLASGLWHGAGWNYIAWGLYYGVLIAIYQRAGLGGSWKPSGWLKTGLAWLVMFTFIVFGWAMFRSPSLAWLGNVLFHSAFARSPDDLAVSLAYLSMIGFYSLPLMIKMVLDRFLKKSLWVQAAFYAAAAVVIIVYINSASPDFIYFQF